MADNVFRDNRHAEYFYIKNRLKILKLELEFAIKDFRITHLPSGIKLIDELDDTIRCLRERLESLPNPYKPQEKENNIGEIDELEIKPCPICGGTGVTSIRDMPCPACNGVKLIRHFKKGY